MKKIMYNIIVVLLAVSIVGVLTYSLVSKTKDDSNSVRAMIETIDHEIEENVNGKERMTEEAVMFQNTYGSESADVLWSIEG